MRARYAPEPDSWSCMHRVVCYISLPVAVLTAVPRGDYAKRTIHTTPPRLWRFFCVPTTYPVRVWRLCYGKAPVARVPRCQARLCVCGAAAIRCVSHNWPHTPSRREPAHTHTHTHKHTHPTRRDIAHATRGGITRKPQSKKKKSRKKKCGEI